MRSAQKLFDFLRPAPHPEPLKDRQEIDRQYRYWRTRIFYSIYVGYALFYFTRKSFTFAMPMMIDDLGFSMADVGFLGSTLYITYGISKFLSGIVADRSNPRYFMGLGLALTGIANLAFGFSSSLVLFALFWGLNGLLQGSGWPPCTKQLTHWFAKSERGFWWSACSTSHNVGGALIPLLAAYCAVHFGWRYAMFVPGVLAIIVGIWLLNRLRDIPQSLGLPPVEVYKGEATQGLETAQAASGSQLGVKDMLVEYVLKNKAVWLLALSYFFVYVVRTAVNDWGTIFLVKEKGYKLVTAAASITWFEVGGFLGTLAAGWGSDRFFQGRRIPYMLICSVVLVAVILVFWLVPSSHPMVDAGIMALIGFLIFGPQMLVGLAAAEFVHKQAACTANGFAGCFAYIGAAVTGYPLGKIIDLWGWQGFFTTLLVCVVCMFAILLPLSFGREKEAPDEELVLGY